jgi:lipopolysaccharide transport system ATP-binding protein
MSDIAVEVDSVWKRFHRGEFHDSLRDFVPALTKRLLGRGPKRDELSKDDFWALRDVSFQVRQGEVLGIIGRNGAGKSTLLKILARILKPNHGQVRVNGRLRALIEVAAGFHGDLTGRENIYLNGTIMGMKRREIDAKFDEIVEFSGIGPFLDTPVKRYSSGMHARLGFAVAAHLDPEILVVDEVLSVGDMEFQKKCLGKMGKVAKEGRTILFVSHNMQAISALCTRAILFKDGQVECDGSTRESVERYMAASSAQVAEMTWTLEDAPGDDVTRLHAVRVIDETGEPAFDHDITKPITVEMDFWVLQPGRQVNASIHVLNDQDMCLFAVGNNMEPAWGDRAYERGLYRATCHIPANYLNDGPHSVSAFVVVSKNKVPVSAEQAVSFCVNDYGTLRGGYFGKIIGAVRPLLPWNTQRLGDLS